MVWRECRGSDGDGGWVVVFLHARRVVVILYVVYRTYSNLFSDPVRLSESLDRIDGYYHGVLVRRYRVTEYTSKVIIKLQ